MIRSMTAFARRDAEGDWGKLTWELRSVNHRYLDVNSRLPEELRTLEGPLRERVAKRLGRGKVEATLRYRPAVEAVVGLELDWRYAEQVMDVCARLATRMVDPAPVSPLDVLNIPGVVAEHVPDLQPVADAALGLLDNALADLVAMRESEGERLARIVRSRGGDVARYTQEVRARREQVNQAVRERMQRRLAELDITVDPARLEQELAYVAQRLDVDEELERLLTHVSEVEAVLNRNDPVGRRLDFLMQELNREANTLSSKSSDAETTQAAVEMKVLIEQMREQVQNIE